MTWSAADDIKLVESLGCTRREALEMVTRRAVFEARRVAREARFKPDLVELERHLLYLDELRGICLAVARRTRERGEGERERAGGWGSRVRASVSEPAGGDRG
jgi:hypothetical protein